MNIKNLFLLVITAFTLSPSSAQAAADNPIILFVDDPKPSMTCNRAKLTIRPKELQANWVDTEEIIPIPSSSTVLTFSRMRGSTSYTVFTDPNAEIYGAGTRIEVLPAEVKVFSYNYQGDLNMEIIYWCGCTIKWARPNMRSIYWFSPKRGVGDDPKIHKCDACKDKKETDPKYAENLETIDFFRKNNFR